MRQARGGASSWWTGTGLVALALLAVVLAALALVHRPQHEVPTVSADTVRPDPAPVLAVFLGDAGAAGLGASPRTSRWTTQVALGEAWYEVNLAHAGTGYLVSSSAADCERQRCASHQDLVDDVVRLQPAVVVVSGGQDDRKRSAREVSRAVQSTYRELRRGLPDARIIAVGPAALVPRAQLEDVDSAVRRAAAEIDAQYISMLSPDPLTSRMLLEKQVGLNNAGHAAVARRVIEELES